MAVDVQGYLWIEKINILLPVRQLMNPVANHLKRTVFEIIPTILTKIRIIQQLIEVLFDVCFLLLPRNLVHNYQNSFERFPIESIVQIDFIHRPTSEFVQNWMCSEKRGMKVFRASWQLFFYWRYNWGFPFFLSLRFVSESCVLYFSDWSNPNLITAR